MLLLLLRRDGGEAVLSVEHHLLISPLSSKLGVCWIKKGLLLHLRRIGLW
jgi:hypothetical protein